MHVRIRFDDEEDATLASEVTSELGTEGFDVEATEGGLWIRGLEQAWALETDDVPTLVVTRDEAGVSQLLDWGAADAVAWPRDRAVFAARVRAMLRTARLVAERSSYRRILDACNVPLFVKGLDGKFIFANQALADLYGVAANRLIGNDSSVSKRPHEAREPLDRFDEELLEMGGFVETEHPLLSSDRVRWYRTQRSLASLGTGQKVVVGISYDITAERAVRQQVERQHALLRQVVDAVPAPIFLVDHEDRFIVANETTARMCDRMAGAMIGLSLRDVSLDTLVSAHWVSARQQAVASGRPCSCEVSRPDGSGNLRHYLCVVCPVPYGSGQECVLTVATDITERRASEERLAQYRQMFSMGRTLALVADEDGKILHASPGWYPALGYNEELLVGASLVSFLHPEDRVCSDSARDCGTRMASMDGTENRWLATDGSYHRLAWAATYDTDQKRLYAVAHDVTELRRAQRAAEDARTRAIEASRIKSQFLANMSHEIRTPMNGVLGMTSLALETSLTAEQREYLEAVHTSAESLLAIINDILDISKIEAGKLTLESVPFALRDAVQAALAPLQVRAKQKGLDTRVEVDPALPRMVLGDPVRFRQLLVNLVGNSLKFTSQGSVSVQVRRDETIHDAIHVAVTDTGIGIPPDKQEGIFNAFQQAEESTTRTFGGTGLGLSICRELTHLMGGRIWVESELGVGSTFRFTVRMQPIAEDAFCPLPEPAESGTFEAKSAPASTRKLRVLLAEDNPVGAKLAIRMLEREGCEVVHADNGQKALDYATSQTFDMAFLDLQMPIMDGLECTRRFRAQEKPGSRLPIIALTANAMKGDAERCLRAGMDAHVPKPIDRAQLRDALERVRAGGQSWRKPSSEVAVSVDVRHALERCDGDMSLFVEVVTAYSESARDGVSALEAAVAESDADGVYRAAHSLKGLFKYVCAEPSAKLALELELAGRQGRTGGLTQLVEQLKAEAARVGAALRAEVDRPSRIPPAAC